MNVMSYDHNVIVICLVHNLDIVLRIIWFVIFLAYREEVEEGVYFFVCELGGLERDGSEVRHKSHVHDTTS